MVDRAATIQRAADLIDAGAFTDAAAVIAREYPFKPGASLVEAVRETGLPIPSVRSQAPSSTVGRRRRKLSLVEQHRLFLRDGYRCGYSGIRLICPAALLLVSELLPNHFPCTNYPNCPLKQTHVGLWFLFPSPDHVESFAGGGDCAADNLVTASSAVNMVKSKHSLTALGWVRRADYDDVGVWDGMTGWFTKAALTHCDVVARSRYAGIFRDWLAVATSSD